MKAKKTLDYVKRKEQEPIWLLAARVPLWKKAAMERKMKDDGFESLQELVNAMVDRYLDEK